ncbi:hypothetical protein CEXT_562181 [Caerostris extrusa]|uniref:Uncharacterized protein n=1 Tax=Caerostris extrusa TaxID=172846 RepID=A0AAV4TIN7_CAEEX|nr:hypothetical protein CEXT_562181 [Caerostris extrusa]
MKRAASQTNRAPWAATAKTGASANQALAARHRCRLQLSSERARAKESSAPALAVTQPSTKRISLSPYLLF